LKVSGSSSMVTPEFAAHNIALLIWKMTKLCFDKRCYSFTDMLHEASGRSNIRHIILFEKDKRKSGSHRTAFKHDSKSTRLQAYDWQWRYTILLRARCWLNLCII
jgi:hypothetical protein